MAAPDFSQSKMPGMKWALTIWRWKEDKANQPQMWNECGAAWLHSGLKQDFICFSMNYRVKPLQQQSGVTKREHLIFVQEYCILCPHFSNAKWMFFHSAGGTLPSSRGAGGAQKVLNTTIPCWHTVCLLPLSDLCRDSHSSVLVRFTSISGWEREGFLWQVGFELLPQPGLTPGFWGDLYSSSVEAGF